MCSCLLKLRLILRNCLVYSNKIYFTCYTILQAYGHFQEAAVHLRHALELKPDLSDAANALKEVESLPAASIHIYTLLIIICLVRKLKCIYEIFNFYYSLLLFTIK